MVVYGFHRFIPGTPAAARSSPTAQRHDQWTAALATALIDAERVKPPYEAELRFVLPRDRAEEMNQLAREGADVDNLASVVLDALVKARVIDDDNLVLTLRVSKHRAREDEAAGVDVRVFSQIGQSAEATLVPSPRDLSIRS